MRTLVVLKPHPYEGRARNTGDQYTATESDARLLVLAGNCRYGDEVCDLQAAVQQSVADSPEMQRVAESIDASVIAGAQTYQTRDLTASGQPSTPGATSPRRGRRSSAPAKASS